VLRLIPFVCMPSPIPRQDRWACSLVLSHRLRLFPDSRRVSSCITCFEACTAFIFITAYKLAKSPKATLYTRGFSSFVTSLLLRLLPGGANQFPGGTFPAVNQRLFTAHAKVRLGLPIVCSVSASERAGRFLR
jgi:hypothetical protein